MTAPLSSWIPGAAASDFPLRRLPLGVRQRPDGSSAVCTRVGDRVADLRVLAEIGVYDDTGAQKTDFAAAHLNSLLNRGTAVLDRVRARTTACLDDDPNYWDFRQRAEIFLLPADRVELVIPVASGDYTRFARTAEGDWRYREARAGNLVGEGSAGADANWLGDRDAQEGMCPQVGLGLVVGSGAEGPFGYGVVGLADWQLAGGDDEADELRAGRRTVLAPWLTPLEAYGSDAIPVAAHLRARGHVATEGTFRRSGEPTDAAGMLEALRARGAVIRAGDLLALRVGYPEPPEDRWIGEDVARLSVETWTNSEAATR